MRPSRSFILLFFILLLLATAAYLIPGTERYLPSAKDFIPGFFTEKQVENNSLQQQPVITPADSFPYRSDTLDASRNDSIVVTPPVVSPVTRLFDSLEAGGKQMRIMYYGDSQIEGDRITSYLRYSLRKRYGGTGPGLFLPLMPVMYTKAYFVRSSSNWLRYNYLSYNNGEIASNSLGPFMTICRYLPVGAASEKPVRAWVRILPSRTADSAVKVYDRLRIIYGNSTGGVSVIVKSGGKTVLTDTLKTGQGVLELSCPLGGSSEAEIQFEGSSSPDIYGISIESRTGLVVDNIPQRGSAGFEFTMVDEENLGDVYSLLRPNLVIMHYGLNTVRNIRTDYSFYEDGLSRQINLLKRVAPDALILMVSLNDMAYAIGDSIVSYPNVPLIREAQRKAAKRTGALFWDAYAAMGGKGSIVKWSDLPDPLAKKDWTHFTNNGADTIAGLLIDSIFNPSSTVVSTIVGDAARTVDSIANDTTIIKAGAQIEPEQIITPVQGNGRRSPAAREIVTRVFSYDPANPFIFTTPGFWVFLLIVLAGYMFIYRKLAIRSVYLFVISLYFYFKTGGLFLVLLLFITITDYTLGLLIYRSGKKSRSTFFLVLSLVSNLSLLAYFKYAGFITDTINSLAGTDIKVFDLLSALSNKTLGTSFDTSYIILPVGISFFTFQSLSYTIDIYRKRMEPVRNILDFGFYVSFFPHLVAGPIVRASVFIPQIYAEYSLSKREFSHALFMISKGLIKKIVISNFIAVTFIDRVFDAPALYSGFENLLAIYGYGLQIYCDFSGYTDIAIGVALVLGFRLPVNFNSPYKATDITDFWKRWHISLSQWLKDYLYISLGGNRKGKIRTVINLFITMVLGGLWHGASIRFLIWGALHGAGLAIHKGWKALTGQLTSNGWGWNLAGAIITFHFVTFCWIFFRAESLGDVGIMLSQIAGNFSPGRFDEVLMAYAGVIILIVTGYLLHFVPESFKESLRAVFISTPQVLQVFAMIVMAVLLWQLRSTGSMPFIYFRF
ncbi:MAG: MBOAT family O-acyltransferase [Bacteroidales bacterium]